MAGEGMSRERKQPGTAVGSGSADSAGSGASGATYGDAQARELLAGASTLVAARAAWTRRVFARDRHSHPVSPSSERAVRFCVGGALLRATSEQLGVQFKIGERVDPLPGETWASALARSYRYLGHALVRLHLWPQLRSLHEELVDAEWHVALPLR